MKNIFTAFLLLIIFNNALLSQNLKDNNSSHFNDFNFIIHLSKNKLFTEAETVKQKMFSDSTLHPLYKDSVNFYLGMEYYKEKNKEKAIACFKSISDSVFFYFKSRYLAFEMELEGNNLDSASSILNSIYETTSNDLNELQKFESLGSLLLYKNIKKFDSLSSSITFSNPIILTEFNNLKNYSEIQKKIKRKSPFVAGALSAVVPGLGKVYAGNNGQALASFLTCAVFGAVAAENYYRLGITHPQTLFFTGVFGVFYVGNIWGSSLSVQLVKREKELENKHNILVGLKVPIHKFFD